MEMERNMNYDHDMKKIRISITQTVVELVTILFFLTLTHFTPCPESQV